MRWNSPTLRSLVRLALEEDAARRDFTTYVLIPEDLKAEAQIIAKQKGVACGLPFAEACFKQLDPRLVFTPRVREGQTVSWGTCLAKIRGSARAILSAERSALNGLQHLSGVATYTRQQVDRLHSRQTGIYDTRKTLPGWRELQKYAVQCGGGKNHRMSLKDGVLIKENHLKICREVGVDWMKAIRNLRRRYPALPVELEIQTQRDLADAFKLAPHQVLLDNMNPRQLRPLVRQIRSRLPRTEIEISGRVNTAELPRLRSLKVDRISMGRLTHSAPALDCSLDINRVYYAR